MNKKIYRSIPSLIYTDNLEETKQKLKIKLKKKKKIGLLYIYLSPIIYSGFCSESESVLD